MDEKRAATEDQRPKETKALEFFKDWSNYLLVTTVAALGWVATKGVDFSNPVIRALCIWSFALSIVFGIFTLALIPLIAEKRQPDQSLYDVDAEFSLAGPRSLRVKRVCFPQHVLFLAGILLYAIGTAWK